MTNEGERSTSADKGKGKVEDVRELNGKKPQKDEKTAADGKKKDGEPQEGKSPRQLTTRLGAEHVASAMVSGFGLSYANGTKMS